MHGETIKFIRRMFIIQVLKPLTVSPRKRYLQQTS